jgi:hypothetical protein
LKSSLAAVKFAAINQSGGTHPATGFLYGADEKVL